MQVIPEAMQGLSAKVFLVQEMSCLRKSETCILNHQLMFFKQDIIQVLFLNKSFCEKR